jgi:hypothetical protein
MKSVLKNLVIPLEELIVLSKNKQMAAKELERNHLYNEITIFF